MGTWMVIAAEALGTLMRLSVVAVEGKSSAASLRLVQDRSSSKLATLGSTGA